MQVVVAHPGRQHSHQLALALAERGLLSSYWSGVPIRDPRAGVDLWSRFSSRIRAAPILSSLRSHYPVFPVARRGFSLIPHVGVANALGFATDAAFDKFVAAKIAAAAPDMVVCYENSALSTFVAAKKNGGLCVLDAASMHYMVQREWNPAQRDPLWVDARKEREIELADVILTCSELAADTYRAYGVPSNKLRPCPLGTDLHGGESVKPRGDRGLRFVHVGLLSRRKGVDILLEAFERLRSAGADAYLTLIGPVVDSDLYKEASGKDFVSIIGPMPQRSLFTELANYDCMILFSRFDSFGMVVAEGMSVGLPVIVSDRVGAKCIVERHPGAGWILPFDGKALLEKLLELTRDRQGVDQAGQQAIDAAGDFTWEAYRQRVSDILLDVAASFSRIGVREPVL